MSVTVLFARRDSIYKTLGCDVWDEDRDALKWPGGTPCITHPPCRLWGRLRWRSKAPESERLLAIWAVEQVRKYGGIVEHPAASLLWKEMNLPTGEQIDKWGGYTIKVRQSDWGHKAEKKTFLYIVGCDRKDLPLMPIRFDAIEYIIETSKRGHIRPKVPKADREATPRPFAEWLIEVAKKCKR